MFPEFASRRQCPGNIRITDQPEDALSSRRYRILIAHEDEPTCYFIQEILEEYQDLSILGRTSDGREAVALTVLHEPDAILMGVNLASLDGVRATYSITETCPRIVVIGFTEHFNPSAYTAMRTAGAAAFVCKSDLLGIHETIVSSIEQSINTFVRGRAVDRRS